MKWYFDAYLYDRYLTLAKPPGFSEIQWEWVPLKVECLIQKAPETIDIRAKHQNRLTGALDFKIMLDDSIYF